MQAVAAEFPGCAEKFYPDADTPTRFPSTCRRRLFAMGASVADIRETMLDFGMPEQH